MIPLGVEQRRRDPLRRFLVSFPGVLKPCGVVKWESGGVAAVPSFLLDLKKEEAPRSPQERFSG